MITVGITGERAVDEVVTCLVRGPASRYPRGYLWLLPAWFVILSVAVAVIGARLNGHLPLWLGASEIGGLLLAMSTAVCVLLTARRAAFRADDTGILLGSRTIRKRPGQRRAYLPWSEVAQITLVPRRYTVLADIVLGPAAMWVPPPSRRAQAALLFGALLWPFGVGRGRPALTMARHRPPGYRVRICEMTAGQLRLALHQLAPETVPVRVVNSMSALRALTPQSRRPNLLRPVWPASSAGQLGQAPSGKPPTTPSRP
jgi:hypothetical protein